MTYTERLVKRLEDMIDIIDGRATSRCCGGKCKAWTNPSPAQVRQIEYLRGLLRAADRRECAEFFDGVGAKDAHLLLADCAPEMARVLLEIEHEILTCEDARYVCRPDGLPVKIDALLRKAGVR